MENVSSITEWLFFCIPLILVTGACLYNLAVTIACIAFRAQRSNPASYTPQVSILKPVHGIEKNFYSCLRSHFAQDYPEFEIIFGLSGNNDSARWTISQLRNEFPHVPVKVLNLSAVRGANPKMGKLDVMLREANYETILINDADIRVPPDYLRKVVQPLADKRVGLVTCLYRGIPARGLLSVLEALGMSGDFAGQVLLARMVGEVQFGLGATLITEKQHLSKIGGFARWADYLADDFILGNQIAKRGLKIYISHTVIETVLPLRTIKDWFAQQLRWARTVRFSSPRGYPGLLLSYGIPLALIPVSTHPLSHLAQISLTLAILTRWISAMSSGILVCGDTVISKYFWLYPLRDIISFLVWLASFMGRTVTWRQVRYRLEAGGRITPA